MSNLQVKPPSQPPNQTSMSNLQVKTLSQSNLQVSFLVLIKIAEETK